MQSNLFKLCCWNTGTVIEAKIAYSSIDCTATPKGSPFDLSYGFGGMDIETGETITAEGEQSVTITLSDPYTPAEVEIPAIDGKITFLTDFWIESVTPPA